MHENSVPGMVFGSRRDLLGKNLRSVGQLQKLCKLFPQALNYLKGAALFNMRPRLLKYGRLKTLRETAGNVAMPDLPTIRG